MKLNTMLIAVLVIGLSISRVDALFDTNSPNESNPFIIKFNKSKPKEVTLDYLLYERQIPEFLVGLDSFDKTTLAYKPMFMTRFLKEPTKVIDDSNPTFTQYFYD